MKKALSILLIFSICLASCKKDDDDNNRSSSISSSSSGPGDFMISLTIDGVTHKAEGSLPNDLMSGGPTTISTGNHCLKYVNNTVFAGLSDKSANSYISGEVFNLNMTFTNLSLGNSIGQISSFPTTNMTFPNNVVLAHGFRGTIDTGGVFLELNFNITDLGTIGSVGTDPNNYYTFGNPIRGSFSGTMYGCDGTTIPYTGPSISYGRLYNIPVQIEIEFIAARFQY